MTDQKNPPRTREEQIRQVACSLKSTTTDLSSYEIQQVVTAIVEEAEARGRAEALAELRAGAEPVGWELERRGFLPRLQRSEPNDIYGDMVWKRRVYADHPPVPREAELAAEVERLTKVLKHVGLKDVCRCPVDLHEDPVEQLATELAFLCEDAELSPNDLVTINRDKLRDVARRAIARAALAAAPETRG